MPRLVRSAILVTAVLTALTPVPSFGTSVSPWPSEEGFVVRGSSITMTYNDASGSGHVKSFHVGTGRLAWKADFPNVPLHEGLCVTDRLVCVPTLGHGTYILSAHGGAKLGTLHQSGLLACTESTVVMPANYETNDLVGYDSTRFSERWRRSLGSRKRVEKMISGEKTVVVWLSLPPRGDTYESIEMSDDGRIVSRDLARKLPSEWDTVPRTLPSPVLKRLARLLRMADGVFIPRVRVYHTGDLWIVGMRSGTDPGGVYAIHGRTGGLVWKRDVPRIDHMVLAGDRLVIEQPLMALDPKTGHILWKVNPIW